MTQDKSENLGKNLGKNLLRRVFGQNNSNADIALEAVRLSLETQKQHIQQNLFDAIAANDSDAMSLALKEGADPNECDKEGCAPLFLAIENGFGTGIKSLLTAEAELDFRGIKDDYGRQYQTAFHRAIELGQKGMAEILYQAGADVNLAARGAEANVPLGCAILKNDLPLTHTLIAMKAKIDCPHLDVRAPIFLAVRQAKLPILAALTENIQNIDITTKNGETLLMMALEAGRIEAINHLLEAGANPNALDNNGKSVLQRAIGSILARPHIPLLLRYHADPDYTDFSKTDYEPPLVTALRAKKTDIFDQILEAGADPNLPDYSGCTPLEIAGKLCADSMIKLQKPQKNRKDNTEIEDLRLYRAMLLQLRLYGARCSQSYIQRLGDRFTDFLPSRRKRAQKRQKRGDMQHRLAQVASHNFNR